MTQAPAVALLGPRQCGKTTLAKAQGGLYLDLENPRDRARVDVDWESLTTERRVVVLDEAQTAPELFPRLRSAIDAERARRGRFLLLGSVSPTLMHHVSESLAGRLALLELGGLLVQEVGAAKLDTLWLRGGLPEGLLARGSYPGWQQSYLQLLAGLDLPGWGMHGRPQETQRLFAMLAAAHGQIWNASDLGRSLGLNHQTVLQRLDHLEGAYLVRRLLPYSGNLAKRLIKAPKVYWRDSGLLHQLLGVADRSHLLAQPWVGRSWEGFVIEQMLGALNAAGRAYQACYVRSSDGYEVDLLLDLGRERVAVEVKLTTAPATQDLARLRKAGQLVKATRHWLVCRQGVPSSGADAVMDLPQAVAALLALKA